MAQKRFFGTALTLSLALYLTGLFLIFFMERIEFSLAWVAVDCLVGVPRLRETGKILFAILPLAFAIFCLTLLTHRDGQLVLDGLCTLEGIEAGLASGTRLVLLAVFARTCLVRFGSSYLLILLSWLFWPVKAVGLGPRLLARTVVRSLLLIPASIPAALALFRKKPARRVAIVPTLYPRRDTWKAILAGGCSLMTGLALILASWLG